MSGTSSCRSEPFAGRAVAASGTLGVVAVLARVTEDLEQPRGPDVMHSVEAPSMWFTEGASIEVRLPRLLTCARCEGGGCDLCGRRGAFEQASSGAPGEVEVTLTAQPPEAAPAPVRLRLPGSGACAPEAAGLPNGHLILTLLPRPMLEANVSASVRKLPTSRAPRVNSAARIWEVMRSLTKVLSRWLSR